jgi:hypothetical protein
MQGLKVKQQVTLAQQIRQLAQLPGHLLPAGIAKTG